MIMIIKKKFDFHNFAEHLQKSRGTPVKKWSNVTHVIYILSHLCNIFTEQGVVQQRKPFVQVRWKGIKRLAERILRQHLLFLLSSFSLPKGKRDSARYSGYKYQIPWRRSLPRESLPRHLRQKKQVFHFAFVNKRHRSWKMKILVN